MDKNLKIVIGIILFIAIAIILNKTVMTGYPVSHLPFETTPIILEDCVGPECSVTAPISITTTEDYTVDSLRTAALPVDNEFAQPTADSYAVEEPVVRLVECGSVFGAVAGFFNIIDCQPQSTQEINYNEAWLKKEMSKESLEFICETIGDYQPQSTPELVVNVEDLKLFECITLGIPLDIEDVCAVNFKTINGNLDLENPNFATNCEDVPLEGCGHNVPLTDFGCLDWGNAVFLGDCGAEAVYTIIHDPSSPDAELKRIIPPTSLGTGIAQ